MHAAKLYLLSPDQAGINGEQVFGICEQNLQAPARGMREVLRSNPGAIKV